MSKPIEKKVNQNKPVVTQKHKDNQKNRIARRKKSNPNLNTWRIGLKGRLRRLKAASIGVSGDRGKMISARIDEIGKLFRTDGASLALAAS